MMISPSPHDYTNNVSNVNLEDNPLQVLKKLKLSNVNRLIIGGININSTKGKFDAFKLWVKGNIDIIVVVESKIDVSFTQQQFAIEGYHLPFRRDVSLPLKGIIYLSDEMLVCH